MRRMISPSCWGVQHVTDWRVVLLSVVVVGVVVVVVVGVVVDVVVVVSGGSVPGSSDVADPSPEIIICIQYLQKRKICSKVLGDFEVCISLLTRA